MGSGALSAALEREHEQIDEGIGRFAAGLGSGDADPAPLLEAMGALRRHIYLEEEFVFPPLRRGGLVMAILVMLREHGEIWDAMARLDELLAVGAEPGALSDACRDLLGRLEAHNAKEEPVIYPQADAQLTGEAAERLQVFLEEGRMPAGWRCEKATR